MKGIAVLGSTGVIGGLVLELVRENLREFKVISLVCRRKTRKFLKQVEEFNPKVGVATDVYGDEKMIEAVVHPDVDLVVVAVVGLSGLQPTLAAIKAGKDVALATKEVLVVAGEMVMREVKKNKVYLIPIDSEHSAIYQCLEGQKRDAIRRLILTMGKGKIAEKSKKELDQVSIDDVLNRRVWKMGKKIAVDSATCMNKAFEVVEACWLFGVKPTQIELLVHPEYMCHSMVEFVDGSMLGEFGVADMRRYVKYALHYPVRVRARSSCYLDLVGRGLSFEKPPFDKFGCLGLGFEALERGGTMAAVMHGADRAAVEAFLEKSIKFTDVPALIKRAMDKHKPKLRPSIKAVFEADKEGEDLVNSFVKKE